MIEKMREILDLYGESIAHLNQHVDYLFETDEYIEKKGKLIDLTIERFASLGLLVPVEEEECPECINGISDGLNPSGPKTCMNCHGTGKVTRHVPLKDLMEGKR